jgi:hypothetical protein
MRSYSRELHRAEQAFVLSLRRQGDDFDGEPFIEYLGRVGPLLPGLPSEILEQWMFRHDRDISDYAWLSLRDLQCRPVTWSLEEIAANIDTTWSEELIAKHQQLFLSNSELTNKWLVRRMSESGTWPVPPIILDNSLKLLRPDGLELGTPYHFVEGHHRMGYLRALASTRRAHVNHRLWVLAPNEAEVMTFWPMNDLDTFE